MTSTADLIFAISFIEDGCLVSSHNEATGNSSLCVASDPKESPDNNRDFMRKCIMDFIDDELDEKLVERQNAPNPPTPKGDSL